MALPLTAQSTQYVDPGSLAEPLLDRREAIREAVDGARWRLGALRVQPLVTLRELARVEQADSEGGTVRDLTATAGAGLEAYLPVGSRATLAAQALPEYVWWRDRDEERRWAGRYGLGAFVFSHRLALELLARSRDATVFASPELDRRAPVRDERLEARVEVPVSRSLAVFARGAAERTRTGGDEPDPALSLLDRDESWWAGGVRWSRGEEVSVALGAGGSRAGFERADALRANRGTSLYGELRWQRSSFDAAAELFAVELEADGSSFAGFDDTLGTARLRWQPRERFALSLYGLSALAWSLDPERTHYLDRRRGGDLAWRPGWRTSLRLFAESGELRYGPGAGGERRDDVTSVGAGGSFGLRRGLALAVSARRTRVENAALGIDRETSELRCGLTLGSGAASVF